MSKRNTATKQTQSKPAPVDADAPIPFVPTEPAPKPKPAPRMTKWEERERILADELEAHRQLIRDELGRPADPDNHHPHHLPLVSLLSYALCGEEHPHATSVLDHLADDIEAFREASSAGESDEPRDGKVYDNHLWGWSRRARVAQILAQRALSAADRKAVAK